MTFHDKLSNGTGIHVALGGLDRHSTARGRHQPMMQHTPRIERAIDIAIALVTREVNVRTRLNPSFCKDELWAAVTADGQILVGTPLLRDGQGTYVDHQGRLMAA